jgi:phage terminase Nu1 subunit (DNA packaging protein)
MKQVKTDISDIIVNTDVLAGAFGYTRQRINQLAKEGVLEKKAPGRFELLRNLQKYLEFVRLGKRPDEEEEASAQYWEEKALHEKAKRQMAELKLAKIKNQLHDANDVEMAMTNMLTTFRSKILAIPQKVSPKLIGMENLAEIGELINSELLEALEELSNYDPALFAGGDLLEDEDDEAIPPDGEGGCSTTKANG